MVSRELMQLRRDFCKDYSMPITVFEDPYFGYFLNLYEDVLGSRTKYDRFYKLVSELGYQPYRALVSGLKTRVIDHVKENTAYVAFNAMDMDAYKIEKREYKQDSVTFYSIDHCDRKWISVDLVTANFNALRSVDPEIVDGCDTYGEFVSRFNESDVELDLKPLRQVIFGNLNPKRQQVVQKYLLHNLMTAFSDAFPDVVFHGTTADEFVVDYSEDRLKWLNENIVRFDDEHKTRYRTEVFELFKLGEPSELGFYEKFEDGSVKLVSTSKIYFAQAYKYLKGADVVEEDLYFTHENRVAKFLKPLMECDGL